MTMRPYRPALLTALACLTACFSHRVQMDPIEVKPIHVTVDVNVKVQRELDKFFDFETPSSAPTTNRKREEQR
jgi:hypothetical protein